MADLIRHKRSSTASAVPSAGQLELGELAVNVADGRLYLKRSSGAIVALANLSELLGVGQTAQNVTASRAAATTYTNSTSRPIMVMITLSQSVTSGGTLDILIDGVVVGSSWTYGSPYRNVITFIVPAGSTYRANVANGTIYNWSELR